MQLIDAIKMKILPQMTYSFTIIPVTPTDNWFKSLNSITQFYCKKLWYHKQHYKTGKPTVDLMLQTFDIISINTYTSG